MKYEAIIISAKKGDTFINVLDNLLTMRSVKNDSSLNKILFIYHSINILMYK